MGSERVSSDPPISAPTHPHSGLRLVVVGRLALILVGLAIALGLTEISLHLLGPRLPGLYNLATFQRYHETYGFFHQPGARGWVRTPEFTSYVQVNSRGLRDRETTLPKPEDRFRLLVLGDSFVEGAQVALDETLPKQVERLLGGGQGGAGRPLDAVNAGNAGFGTAQEMLFLEREGPVYQPDLVILVFYVDNDAANNGVRIAQKLKLDTSHRLFFVLDGNGELRQLPLAPIEHDSYLAVKDTLRSHSLLFAMTENLMTAKASAKRYHAMRMDRDRNMYRVAVPPEWEEAWRVTDALLARTRASAEALGAELLVVGAPSQFQIYEKEWHELIGSNRPANLAPFSQEVPNRRLAEATARAGVRFLDLLPAFQAAAESGDTSLYFPNDGHWTPAGHALAARHVVSYLNEHGLIADADGSSLAITR